MWLWHFCHCICCLSSLWRRPKPCKFACTKNETSPGNMSQELQNKFVSMMLIMHSLPCEHRVSFFPKKIVEKIPVQESCGECVSTHSRILKWIFSLYTVCVMTKIDSTLIFLIDSGFFVLYALCLKVLLLLNKLLRRIKIPLLAE